MTFTKIVKRIEGLYLTEQHLEAVLLQAAFIEGILKRTVDFKYWIATQGTGRTKGLDSQSKKIVEAFGGKVKRMTFYELIDIANQMGLIDQKEKKLIHKYREERNKVHHSLFDKITRDDFEEQLEVMYITGKKIMENKDFALVKQFLESDDVIADK